MRRQIEKKWFRWLAGLCGLAIIITGACVGWNQWNRFQDEKSQLSREQIDQLREEYPLADAPAMMEVLWFPVENQKKVSDTFIYGEIIGEKHYFDRTISIGDKETDEKLAAKGGNTFSYFEVPIRIIKDSEGLYQEGDEITIWANRIYEETAPKMEPGMRIVAASSDGKIEGDPPTRKSFSCLCGFYYVTDDDYVISAIPEEMPSTLTRSRYTSGLKVDALLRRLKK